MAHNKIVGFLVSKAPVKFQFDFFNAGLSLFEIRNSNQHIYIWGIGEVGKCKVNNKFTLSFPYTESLLDRNILITINETSVVIENDWLGSIPVFYNPKECIVSTLSLQCLKEKEIDTEGLANYCEFGYSILEKTVFKDVLLLRYFSEITVTSATLDVHYKNDPVLNDEDFGESVGENDVITLMQKDLNGREELIEGDIIIPTSGGYDSRILNYLIKNKSRIRSFTYGISKDQSKSSEVVYAKKIAEILGTNWQRVELNNFHTYIDPWFNIYGFSTHLHGMYQINFYKEILSNYKFNDPTLLSGIFGDIWAGSLQPIAIEGYSDIINLGYTHGMNLDLKFLKVKSDNLSKIKYFEENRKFFQNHKLVAVFTIRLKIVLISYLCQIPEYLGIPVWTPFLNYKIAISTLKIEEAKRAGRVWQKQFFRNIGLNVEEMKLKSVLRNKLDYEIGRNSKLDPIDLNLMNSYIETERLHSINKILTNMPISEHVKNLLLDVPKIGRVLNKVGFRNDFLKSLHEYYVIKAIEKALKK